MYILRMEVAYEHKITYVDTLRESRLQELRAMTVALWIDREVKYGFVSSELEVIQDIEEYFLKWLVANERFDEAIWIRDELKRLRKLYETGQVVKKGLTNTRPVPAESL
jgi:hypothetical protein